MSDTLDLCIDHDQYARIRESEAVVVRHYIGQHGPFAKLIFIGTLAECEYVANTKALLIVHNGVEYDGDVVVPTSELLPPVEEKSK